MKDDKRNRLILLISFLLILFSIILLARMYFMRRELNELNEYENSLYEQMLEYSYDTKGTY